MGKKPNYLKDFANLGNTLASDLKWEAEVKTPKRKKKSRFNPKYFNKSLKRIRRSERL